jgi:hypothetical protein
MSAGTASFTVRFSFCYQTRNSGDIRLTSRREYLLEGSHLLPWLTAELMADG